MSRGHYNISTYFFLETLAMKERGCCKGQTQVWHFGLTICLSRRSGDYPAALLGPSSEWAEGFPTYPTQHTHFQTGPDQHCTLDGA